MAPPDLQGGRAVRVTHEDVRRLCEFIYRRTGMLFEESKRYYIDRRLTERIAATGSESFQAYFAMLRSDAREEIEHLVNAFTVNETYFYREEHQLRCMTSHLLDDLLQRKQAGEHTTHLVNPVLDGGGAVFHRDLADGKLEPGRQTQHRDRGIGHRYAGAESRRGGHLRRKGVDAAVTDR